MNKEYESFSITREGLNNLTADDLDEQISKMYTKHCDIDCEETYVHVDGRLNAIRFHHVHSPRAQERINMARTGPQPKIKTPSKVSLLDQSLRELSIADKEEADKFGLELAQRAEAARKAIDESRKASTEISVMPDKVVSPFRNYQRPVASPKMEVAVPFETDTGVVMPPLPEHTCEFPEVIETKKDKFADQFSNAKKDKVLLPNNSVFKCVCGKAWWVSVRPVPFHAAKYEGQHVYGWHEIRWYNFARKADLRKREAQ
jgi:hypothetical protein